MKDPLNKVLDNLPAIVWEIEGNPTMVTPKVNYVNYGITAITGYHPEDLISGSIKLSRLFEKKEWERFVKDRIEILSTGITRPLLYKMIRKDKSTVWVKNYPTITTDDSGNSKVLRSILLDVTNEVTAISERDLSEKKLRKSLEANVMGVGLWDGDRLLTQLNKKLLKMIKRTSRTDLSLYDIFPKEERPKFTVVKRTLAKHLSFKPFESVIVDRGGKIVPVLVSGISLSEDDTNVLLFIDDISDKKEVESNKNEFISVASHELKTPVTSMKIYAELLRRSLVPASDSMMYLEKICNQINKLTDLVQELLDISRLGIDKLALYEDYIPLNTVVCEVSYEMQETFSRHTVVIHESGNVMVKADKMRLTQVLVNLLSNAVKYSPKSQVVEVIIKSEGKMGWVGVRDYGIGISKINQRKLFQPFFRAAGENEKTFPGLGVGLYISSQIIQRHGGKMWVESKKGQGSTFWFSLPQAV